MKINIGVFCVLLVWCITPIFQKYVPPKDYFEEMEGTVNIFKNFTNMTLVKSLPKPHVLTRHTSTSPNIVFDPVEHAFNYSWDDSDTFFDRVVFLRVDKVSAGSTEDKYKEIISTGVFITERHVLTSFNPFRELLPVLRSYDIVVAVLRDRTIINDTYTRVTHLRINCARQIIPLLDIDMNQNAWHGVKFQRHTPLHDLMIARVAGTMRFTNIQEQTIPVNSLDFLPKFYKLVYPNKTITGQYLYDNHTEEYYKTKDGPYLVHAAKPYDTTEGRTFQFASIAFEDDDHIKESKELRTKTFTADALVDCEEYLVPEWGEFICIRDDDNYPGIGSGSILFSGESVYGIGSFKITKSGGVSIFVFTDVRKYNHLLYKTCTNDDHMNILDEQDYNFYAVSVNLKPVLQPLNKSKYHFMFDTSKNDDSLWHTYYWQYTL